MKTIQDNDCELILNSSLGKEVCINIHTHVIVNLPRISEEILRGVSTATSMSYDSGWFWNGSVFYYPYVQPYEFLHCVLVQSLWN